MAAREFKGVFVAGGEILIFSPRPAMPNRTDRVDHIFGRQPKTRRQLGFAGWAALELAAGLQKLRSGGAMDSAVNSAAAQKRAIGGIDDGVQCQAGDIADEDIE